MPPFNVGIITSGLRSLNQGTALSPSLALVVIVTGLFSPLTGKQTLVSVGASILNINQVVLKLLVSHLLDLPLQCMVVQVLLVLLHSMDLVLISPVYLQQI